jgi:ring-1,2-phenylacetyl-CoA epoxidase subunit PaaD
MTGAAADRLARARTAAEAVVDPEIPVLTIADLGVLRDAFEIEAAVERAGLGRPRVTTVLHPAWTTDWLTAGGREKLRAYGIAPPEGKAGGRRALFGEEHVACPRCGSRETEKLAEFGSTTCKALWRCRACREPFDHFKCI